MRARLAASASRSPILRNQFPSSQFPRRPVQTRTVHLAPGAARQPRRQAGTKGESSTLADLKGYVSNLRTRLLASTAAEFVVNADLRPFRIEIVIRMSKIDPRTRPMHHQRELCRTEVAPL